jgi:hypothetical protein
MSATPAIARKAGLLQGIALLLPITMAVVGVSVFTATVADALIITLRPVAAQIPIQDP